MLKLNLAESQEQHTLHYNKQIKEPKYWPCEFVWLSEKQIKTKRNSKLEHKYLGPFEIVEAVENKADMLKLPVKKHILSVFHISRLGKDYTRKQAVDQNSADQLVFEKNKESKQEIDSIVDSRVFSKEVIDGRPPRLYYLIH